MTEQARIGTGASYGAIASDQHARQAVLNALKQVNNQNVGSVILFLSDGYAHQPQAALKEAVKASGTPQVFGCCAAGLLFDQEWLLDTQGAVAMVLPRELSLHPCSLIEQLGLTPELALTISSPNAAEMACNALNISQIGGVCSDQFGDGPYSLWQSGRIVEREYLHTAFPAMLDHQLVISEGVRRLSPIMQINLADGHRLFEIGEKPAVDSLLRYLPESMQQLGLEQPYNLLCGISENKQIESIQHGHFALQHIVSTEQNSTGVKSQEIHISGHAAAGQHLFWALRDPDLAQVDMAKRLVAARESRTDEPLFALMFSNISRGPQFYAGPDKDFDMFKQSFPITPMIGFYGNGEIAPGHRLAGTLKHYTCAISLFYAKQ